MFDETGQIRFDHAGPGWVVDASTVRSHPDGKGRAIAENRWGIVSHKYFKSSKQSGDWQTDQTTIELGGAQRRSKHRSLLQRHGIGAIFPSCDDARPAFDEMTASLEKMKLVGVDRKDPNVWLLSWSFADVAGEAEWKLWVDVDHGFTPVCYEERNRLTGEDRWWATFASKTGWAQQRKVWVPVHHEFVAQPIWGKWRDDESFDLVWETVNEPISQQYFDWRGFEAPDAISVIDHSLGESVVIRQGNMESQRPGPPNARAWSLIIGLAAVCAGHRGGVPSLALWAAPKPRP